MLEELRRAIDLAQAGAWHEAADALDGLPDPAARPLREFFTERGRLERDLDRSRNATRHELANFIAIALANAEAMLDGTFEPTPQRLGNVCAAMRAAAKLLEIVEVA